ncbi:MAG: hypothetical protein IT548_11495 [Alphaproteobacteria bacterium]|nr:hypothetical protein [Alphaproteobacteria bacterium]
MRTTSTAAAAALSAALMLGACATTPLYQPQASERGSGYAEQKLDRNNYRVTFTGRRTTSRERVEDALMLRAAEVTRQAGYTHFTVDARATEREKRGGYVPFTASPGFGPYGRWGWGWGRRAFYDPYWYDLDFYYDADRNARYVATANISMLTAEEARGRADAISADEVIANLHDKVDPVPPPPK